MDSNCVRMLDWCHPSHPRTCNELIGTTATGKTIDTQLCSNQSFWEHKTCDDRYWRRCTGARPGQCGSITKIDYTETYMCKDGSSEIDPADGDCGEDLKCRAIRRNLNVCIKDEYKCDGIVNCYREEDEENCNRTTRRKCEWYDNCDKAYMAPRPGVDKCEDMSDLMCRARNGRWAGKNICLKKKFLCDNYIQCEDGRDEEHCEDEYLHKSIFPRDYNFVCKSPFLEITTEENKTDRFFPMRAIRFTSKSQSLSSP